MTDQLISRRDVFNWGVQGLGATALLSMLQQDGVLAAPVNHHKVRAKRAVHICLVGGMSHIDSFDYKPQLAKRHGTPLGNKTKPDIFFGRVGLLRKNDFKFKQRGKSGLWISDMFPNIAKMADEMTLIRSMTSESANHTPALFVQNSGFQFNGFPAMGSWLSFGLGAITDSLPSYVVLPDGRGGPNGGATNWSNGFLPAENQGVVLQGGKQPIRDLFPAGKVSKESDAATRSFLNVLNKKHQKRSGLDRIVSARMRSYQLAAKMQLSIPKVADLSSETKATHNRYGINNKRTADAGRRCLLGRRLLEQGVRFVQIYSGGPIAGSPRASWDAHESVKQNHGYEASRIDQPVAALMQDLKQRDMLKDTLVLFTTEFGRTPFAQSAANKVGPGRDHNRYGFSSFMAGAGVKAGFSYGSTDEVGWKAVKNPMPWPDFHATLLHMFGIDHEKLTFYHNGIMRRLTNVHGHVHKGILS